MKLSSLAKALAGSGLNVVETNGWSTRGVRGRDMAGIKGVLWHHTATNRARFNKSNAPTLGLCTNGRTGLSGPLCHIVLGRDGTCYLVAAGAANHAGRGAYPGIPRNSGNSYLIGIEMESSGIAPWDWTQAQLDAAPLLGAALQKYYNISTQIGHYEWTSRKIDPAGWPGGMDGLRGSIKKHLRG